MKTQRFSSLPEYRMQPIYGPYKVGHIELPSEARAARRNGRLLAVALGLLGAALMFFGCSA